MVEVKKTKLRGYHSETEIQLHHSRVIQLYHPNTHDKLLTICHAEELCSP